MLSSAWPIRMSRHAFNLCREDMMKFWRRTQPTPMVTREEPCDTDATPLAPLATLALPPPVPLPPLSRAILAVLRPLDRLLDRVYGSALNPLYQSGALAIFLLALVVVTGLYLLLFYAISDPYASVLRLHEQQWSGRWIRALHRYASDAAVIAIGFHVLRMLAQGRTWGPRVVAWVSGTVLTGVIMVSGWTGQVMVWDVQAQLLALEGAKLFDLLPIFSEPLSRAFLSHEALPRSFFFLNLFVHITLPLGGALLLWVHVSRVARPVLFPPKPLAWGVLGALGLSAMVWPPYMLPKAEALRLPTTFAIDWFFCFWLPIARQLPASGHGLFWLVLSGALLSVPWWLRPRPQQRPAPSYDNVALCQGCDQCWQDCPFEAILMVPRPEPRGRASERMAVVDESLCVSCGLCAGSCTPMAIGPPQRTGRVQLQALPQWLRPQSHDRIVVLACRRNDLSHDRQLHRRSDIQVYPIDCPGSLHTSVIEHILRLGAPGVCILSCPQRNCWHREGPQWLVERVYHDREAELPHRVDRRQVCIIHGASGERREVVQALDEFCARLAPYAPSPAAPSQRTTLVTHIRRFIPRLLMTGLFLALLTVGNRTPVGQPGREGVLRLAWRLPGARIQSCRTLTEAELASKPLHMRQPRECVDQPLHYRLQVTLNGTTRLDERLSPAGARGDRPLYVQHEVRLAPGTYPLQVDFQPLLPETLPPQARSEAEQLQRHLTLHQHVSIAADQITLVTLAPGREKLVVIEREPDTP